MADYLIKDIPEETMKDFKTACAYLKRTMREDFLASMAITIHQYKGFAGIPKAKQSTIKKKGKNK